MFLKCGLCFAQKICLQGFQGHKVFLSDLDTGYHTCADHKLLPPLTDFITGYHFSIAAMQLYCIFRRQERSAAGQPAPQEAEPESTADAEQSDSASSNARERQKQTSHAFPREGKELFLTYYNLAMPEDEDVVTRYFTDRPEDSFIALDPDDFRRDFGLSRRRRF